MQPDHTHTHRRESDRAAVRRALAAAGVTGAALVLTAATAAPALAAAAGGDSGHGPDSHAQRGQSTAAAARADDGQQPDDGQQSDADQQDASADHAGDGASTAAAHRDSHAGGSQAGGQSGEHAHTGGSPTTAGPAGGAPTGHNPAGNNGTVKVHDLYGDTAHHNVPHVDCDFAVDFWGFDLQQGLSVSFAGQAPTGKDVAIPVSAPTTITSTTDAGGGNDYDGELQFPAGSLDLTGLGAPHPQQGYHVKLTVATGQGGGYKYKVFWLQPCTAPAALGTTTSAGTTTLTPPEVEGLQTQSGTTGTAAAGGTTVAGLARTGQPAEVLGERFVRRPTSVAPAAAGAPGASSLPFTGGEIAGLAAAGAAALAGGAALTVAGRRRRRNALA